MKVGDKLRGIYGVNNGIIENQHSRRNVSVLALIELFPKITREEMSKIFNLSLSTIEKDLQKLRQSKLIKREGADKTGIWKIVNQKSDGNKNDY